ncbi:MAG: glycosyltransferase family 9 protein [Thermodesulfobacteriota bacterium]
MSRPRVLAACTTAIGDTMFCSPALIALGRRFEVDVLVHQNRRPLLVENPNLRRLYSYRNNPLARAYLGAVLSNRSYETLVVLHANDDLMRLMPRLRYERAVNIQGWRRPDLRLESLPRSLKVHTVDERLRLAQWTGAEIQPQDRFMRMFLRPEESERGERWLRQRGLGPNQPRVGMVLGASAMFRRWPADRFGQVAAGLSARGAQVISIGDSHELDLARQAEKMAGQSFARGYNLGLRLLAAVLSRLDLLISNDTGPLHLGQAVGTPVLGLFGPTDPIRVGPRGPRDRVLKVPPTCEPCLERGCRHPICMEQLEAEAVLQTAYAMLNITH